jgi:hypothetical protein
VSQRTQGPLFIRPKDRVFAEDSHLFKETSPFKRITSAMIRVIAKDGRMCPLQGKVLIECVSEGLFEVEPLFIRPKDRVFAEDSHLFKETSPFKRITFDLDEAVGAGDTSAMIRVIAKDGRMCPLQGKVLIECVSDYSSGLKTASLQRIATFLKKRRHSSGSPLILTNSSPLQGKVLIECVSEGLFEVEFVKIKGDPLEWRRLDSHLFKETSPFKRITFDLDEFHFK